MNTKEPIAGTYVLKPDLTFHNDGEFAPLLDRILPLYENGQLPRGFDPIDFPDWIPSLIHAELTNVEGKEGIAFRFFGGAPVAFYGELQDRSIADKVSQETLGRWLEFARITRKHRLPMRLRSEGLGLAYEHLDIESLLVPTSSDGQIVDSIYCFGKYETAKP